MEKEKIKSGFELFIGSTYEGSLDWCDNSTDCIDDNKKIEKIKKICKKNDLNYEMEAIEIIANAQCDVFDDYLKKIDNICGEVIGINSVFDQMLNKYGIRIIKTEFTTPIAYNYRSDMLGFDIDFFPDILTEHIKKDLKKSIDDYLKNYKTKSYSGYINLEPDSIDELIRNIKNGEPAAVYSLIQSILIKENPGMIGDLISEITEQANEAQNDILPEAIDKEVKKWILKNK